MAKPSPKRAVLIGTGMVARTHLAACEAACEKVALAGIYSRSPDRARALADEAQAMLGASVRAYASIDDVAADVTVDFAIILTPPNARAEIIVPLAAAGKHILLEKPVARDGAEAREVVGICSAAGIRLGVVFQHRMRAASLQAAQMIAQDMFGQLGLVEIAVPWWREQSYYDVAGRGSYARDGGGVLISQAIHTIDLALSLAGPVESLRAMAVTSRFHQMEAEDYVVAGLEFANGAAGSLIASTASFPGAAETITLHFDLASLHLEAGHLHISWRDGRVETFGAETGTGGGADPMAFTHEWHQAILEEFADALHENRAPLVTGQAALVAHDLIDAITRAARSGQTEQVAA